jgi:3-oxoacyl-[acyl-carrier protein] reductase
MDLGLKGLRALVTGGSKGIGQRCATLFAAEGERQYLRTPRKRGR